MDCIGSGTNSNMGDGFPTTVTKQFSDSSWVSKNSSRFWHCLPRDSIRFHRLRVWSYKTVPPHPLQTPAANPAYHLCLWPTSHGLEVPTAPSSGWINLLEWFTKLRETFYSLDYWFITKKCNSRTGRLKRYNRTKHRECALSFHASPVVHSSR